MEEQAYNAETSLNEKNSKKKKGKKKSKAIPIIIVSAIVVVLILVVLGYKAVMNSASKMSTNTEKTVVQKYGQHDMSTYVSATGTVRSANVEYISTTLTYKIDDLKVEVGDHINAGDTVCVINTDAINDKIDDLEAQASDEEIQSAKQIQIANTNLSNAQETKTYKLTEASEDVSDAKEDWDDADEDYYEKLATYQEKEAAYNSYCAEHATATDAQLKQSTEYAEWDAAGQALDKASATWYSKESAYNNAVDTFNETVLTQNQTVTSTSESTSLTISNNSTSYSATASSLASYYDMRDEAIIKSNTSGIVTAINAVEGAVPQGTILQVEDDSDLEIEIEVKERDIYKVKEGQEVDISSEVLSEVVGKGVVSKVYQFTTQSSTSQNLSNSGIATSSNSNYKAIIKVTESSGLLLGMKVKVKISMDDEQTVFAVPYTAVMDSSTGSYVYIAKNAGTMFMVEKVDVETGVSGDYYTEIVGGGLEPDDLVITYPDLVDVGSVVFITEQGVTGTDPADDSSDSDADDSKTDDSKTDDAGEGEGE